MTNRFPEPNDDHERDSFDAILSSARNGDPDAVGNVLQQCRDYLLLIANQDLDNDIRHKLGASDLVQESMMTAQACFNEFNGDTPEQLLAWLRGILENDLKHWRRHFKGTQKRGIQREQRANDSQQFFASPADSMFTPSTNAANQEEETILQDAIKTLPENYQRVIQLRSWEDRSFVEIGNMLDCSPDAARKMWSRAILKLHDVLGDSLPELKSTPDDRDKDQDL